MPHPFLEVTVDDIQRLNDEDARALVRRLCEAEVRAHAASASHVLAGGHQNAADDGSDVQVTKLPSTWPAGFILRPESVFQVKAEAMPAGKITDEMRPKGVLRQIIVDLAKVGGAYVIVSTRDNPSDPKLRARRKAMKDAVGLGVAAPELDFYGADRVATWANQYPGVAMWSRGKAGRPTTGWMGLAYWSASDQPVDTPLIPDERSRLRPARGEPVDLMAGLTLMRAALRPGEGVRLVGLSGHGKTRLAQALFDGRVGQNALQPELAIYCDVGRGAEPSPRIVADQLVAMGMEAVLVVDNCPAELHRALIETIRRPGSAVRLLSIEYDVSEDDFEGTAEFHLERASDDLVEALLKARGFDLSDPDRRRIADFSGGNARMALALARSASGRGSLASLNDSELLNRLFGRTPPPDIRAIAEVASLVVSFDVGALSGDGAELPVLAELAEVTSRAFYGAVTALQGLELVQQRGDWRAVLPQALAAKLARSALGRLHPDILIRRLVLEGPPRLFTSFCHRLGLLHDVAGATSLSALLLSPGGLIGDVIALDEEGVKRLSYLAPGAPGAALAALERAWASDLAAILKHPHVEDFVRLIVHLAYDPAHFARALRLLGALPGQDEERATWAGDRFTSLFHLFLSGTAAPPVVRFDLIRAWIAEGRGDMAGRALEAALKAEAFVSGQQPDFGAHQRDYGWRPQTFTEQTAWLIDALGLVVPLAACDRAAARRILAAQFRQLWGYAPARARLIAVTRAVLDVEHDDAVWFAVRETIGFDSGPALALDQRALEDLERDLRPKGAEDLIATYVFHPNYKFRTAKGEAGQQAVVQAAKVATALGVRAAADPDEFARVADVLLQRQQTQAYLYGEGFASQTDDLEGQWMRLTDLISGHDRADPSLLMGFLHGAKMRDEGLVSAWLDGALDQPGVARHLVSLQLAVGLDDAGVARWLRGVDAGVIPMWTFQRAGGAIETLGAETIRPLLLAIAAQADGLPAAVDLLSMRLMSFRDDVAPEPWAGLCRELLLAFRFEAPAQTMLDHHLGELALKGLVGPEGDAVARQVAEAMKAAVVDRGRRYGDCASLARALFSRQPRAALDVLVQGGEEWPRLSQVVCGPQLAPEDGEWQSHAPIHALDPEIARAWVAEDPSTRTARLALAIPFAELGEHGDLVWTSLAHELLEGPYGVSALEAFYPRLSSAGGWGEIGEGWVRRRPLLSCLLDTTDPALAAAAREFSVALEKKIEWAAGIVWRDDQSFE